MKTAGLIDLNSPSSAFEINNLLNSLRLQYEKVSKHVISNVKIQYFTDTTKPRNLNILVGAFADNGLSLI